MSEIGQTLEFGPFAETCFGAATVKRANPWIVPGALVVALGAWSGVIFLHLRPAATPDADTAPPARIMEISANPYGGLAELKSSAAPLNLAKAPQADRAPPMSLALATPDILPPPRPSSPDAVAPDEAADSAAPAPPPFSLGESAPLPAPRPPEFGVPAAPAARPGPSRRLAQDARRPAVASAEPDNRSIFDKLFGLKLFGPSQPQPQSPASAPRTVLAYAPANGGVLSDAPKITSPAFSRYGQQTAVYDISARTVYMPDGTRLEAHSGLGEKMDDPRYVHVPMSGATPPNVYELTPREELFHGVPALRMTPVGGGTVYGRNGFLAHTYMLGANGASNGCVSFRDYYAFLRAYQNGAVKRLIVVARM